MARKKGSAESNKNIKALPVTVPVLEGRLLLTYTETAKALGLSVQTLYNN